MRQPSRFRKQPTVEQNRLTNFVALDNLTSQMPLIEVVKRPKLCRIWVSYDLERVCGTYIDVHRNGMVVCVTRYPAGNTVEKVNRPADERDTKRLHTKPKPSAKDRRHTKTKKVHGRKKNARAKKQHSHGRASA
jgi:hypothetical protein